MDCSIDKSDFLLEYLVEGCGNDELEHYKNMDTSNEQYGNKFERIKKRILSGKKVKTKKEIAITAIKRVSMVFLLCFSMAFITLMSVSATRNAIWNVITEWYDDHFTIRMDDGYDSTQNTVTQIEEANTPTELPKGIEEEIIISNSQWVIAEYYQGEMYVGSFQQSIITESSSVIVDSKSTTIYNETIADHFVTIVKNEGLYNIFWLDSKYFYIVQGYDLEFLIKIIEKIKYL